MLKNSDEILCAMKTWKSRQWMKYREKKTIAFFKETAQRVPAYKDFLKKNNINPRKVVTWSDFQQVPTTNKNTYLREYPMEKLCWDGNIAKPLVYTATSGSTGDPFYFVRGEKLDWQYSVSLEEYLLRRPIDKNNPVLVVVCFGMGLWIGGVITYKGFEIAALRGDYPVSIITPGFNKKEIMNILEKLSPKYSSTIMVGYPPLIKDIVDEAVERGINLPKLNLRFLFAAEAITEDYRDYIQERARTKNIAADFMSIYGSADIGAMATETCAGILIRRLARLDHNLFKNIFSPINKTPTLAQYNPEFITFESPNSEILLTGDSAIPLVRYSIGDNGGTFSFSKAREILKSHGYSLDEEIHKHEISQFVSELPFVYVYERADLSTSYYGLLIYPEWVKSALINEELQNHITSKFTMITRTDKRHNQYLEINLELKHGKKTTLKLKQLITKKITKSLCERSSEFREIYKGLGKLGEPKIIFWPYEDPTYFKIGIKQKWVQKIAQQPIA